MRLLGVGAAMFGNHVWQHSCLRQSVGSSGVGRSLAENLQTRGTLVLRERATETGLSSGCADTCPTTAGGLRPPFLISARLAATAGQLLTSNRVRFSQREPYETRVQSGGLHLPLRLTRLEPDCRSEPVGKGCRRQRASGR